MRLGAVVGDLRRLLAAEVAAGGVEAAFDFRVAYNTTNTAMMMVALKNQQTATEYA